MIRGMWVMWMSALLLWAQGTVTAVVSESAAPAAREAVKRGLEAALVTTEASVLTPKQWLDAKAKAAPDAGAVLLYVTAAEFPAVVKQAEDRGIAAFDLARTGPFGKSSALSAYRDPAEEASCAAYWMARPFVHHDVAVIASTREPYSGIAKAFDKAWAGYPQKRIVATLAPSSDFKATATALAKAAAQGATAVYVAATPAEVRTVAMAARLQSPPLVVVATSHALGFESADAKDGGSQPLPEGTVVVLRDVPDLEHHKALPERAALFAQREGSVLELEAYDAARAASKALSAAGGQAAEAKKALASGTAPGLRGTFADGGAEERALGGRLRYVPWIMDGDRPKPFPPVDPKLVDPRPSRLPAPPGWPLFLDWNSRLFPTVPGSVVVDFDWTDGKQRTIDNELAELCLSTRGRLPVVDHIVREKIMGQILSVASTKFLRNEDGTAKPGESLHVSLVHRKDPKVKAKMVWKCHVTGDDPEAGGRAFGSYCYVYSTFIWRTIFKERAVDGLLGFDDLRDLCLPLAKGDKYVAGTRRNVIRQLIVGFGGSMALTAAHEIGHCGGLGHDEKDPASLMNVKEGAGLAHELGFFIPEHVAILRKTLGTAPNATPSTPKSP